ncbi:class 1 fructose-bisphosphatase [Candidatus Roizmanbacteria bacterium CG02_land_8_20_14_3_00_36_15]|nr:MAG: class 1 fructose-bisphosphatase [Candidatus Roizmanbacteria bacterium CG03_land_8_20_14_0_80_36_21]PIV37389.1 MAG: class 1 fructose-bisphosphatase [Candidatus Roizmanbacteria bacterium CG02_land_8_20_14_3_00_36_15]
MYNKVITLTEFILKEERRFKKATGSFTLLLTQIENAAKIIASHIKKTGLVDIIGQTGKKNVYQEEVQKLDEFSDRLLIDMVSESGQAHAVASEEVEKPIYIKKNSGKYSVFFDPLDGSSNISVNITMGTIFSIYHKAADLKQPGDKQVAAGYIIYGTSVMFVYSAGAGVNGFTLDPSIGAFILSHPNIQIPAKGRIYTINEGYWNLYDQSLKNYLSSIKKEEKPYKTRYAACMVADVHRILFQGGIFMYPSDSKHPQGKLRLMYEVNPMAFLIREAGGLATSNGNDPLKIKPLSLDQRVPIALGSKEEIEKYLKYNS